jgi:hypothetical protein
MWAAIKRTFTGPEQDVQTTQVSKPIFYKTIIVGRLSMWIQRYIMIRCWKNEFVA